jgi:hypothetical protein
LFGASEHLQKIDLGSPAELLLPRILYPGSIDPQQLQGTFDGQLRVCRLDENQAEVSTAGVFRQPFGIGTGSILEFALRRQISSLFQERVAGGWSPLGAAVLSAAVLAADPGC